VQQRSRWTVTAAHEISGYSTMLTTITRTRETRRVLTENGSRYESDEEQRSIH